MSRGGGNGERTILRRTALGLVAASAVLRWVPDLAARSLRGDKPPVPPGTDPPVPPGTDPGGVAVAIIGPGVDYTRPEIAAHLARDGEGEIVGFDLVDNDRRPFEVDATSAAPVVIVEAANARLAIFRVDLSDLQAFARAIGMAAQGPSRIVLIDGAGGDAGTLLLAQAARRFPRLVFVMASTSAPTAASAATTPRPAALLSVAATGVDGTPRGGPQAEPTADFIDLACPIAGTVAGDVASASGDSPDSASRAARIASARIAALAARIAALEPELDGAGLAARITALARPQTGPGATRLGWIADPGKYYPAK